MSKESGFLRWILLLVEEDVVKTVAMTTEVFEYYMNLDDKGVAEFERTDSNLEKVLLWVKCYQTAIAHETASVNVVNFSYYIWSSLIII